MWEELIPLKRHGQGYESHCLHFGKQVDRGWVTEGSPEGVFFLWWLCRKPGTSALASVLHGREVLFSKERPLCSTLLYSLGQKKNFFSPEVLDLLLSWFWTTIKSTVEFWTLIWTTGDTLKSPVITSYSLLSWKHYWDILKILKFLLGADVFKYYF